ncbi:Asp-tRNA(Asn)/Glu-tRNA(Gln) amidotransferase subunit GatC [Candidatus Clavichlamydia salmonicola]|uniref:Asp-tRNA(Asn)/Glu-tRNA(Gln) amidotransferase subunit GatC n=1 Tax=Candidatus Clavichlamydia salmonicola TaxID=469812 RepID=UPI0018918F01|nr:Asp-tRNA(Asn)/Glu-tRNA(Gln) amidotransferase subunit GatC [Candidatus Clavichlamydia salmonicola]
MKNITQDVLNQLMSLSRLKLNDTEQNSLIGDLENIIKYCGVLEGVECEESDFQDNHEADETMSLESLRSDETTISLSQKDFLINVPDHVAGLVKVPPVIKN